MPTSISFNLARFAATPSTELLTTLTRSDAISGFSQLSHNQFAAWEVQIALLKEWANSCIALDSKAANIGIVLEYRIPRREKRLDAAIILPGCVVVLEFKVGGRAIQSGDLAQVEDYSLDLAYYHAASRASKIVAVLCPTELEKSVTQSLGQDALVKEVLVCGGSELGKLLTDIATPYLANCTDPAMVDGWAASAYKPIPGVIDAAIELFGKHQERDISSSLAGSETIAKTILFLQDVIIDAMKNGNKVLCLVTGVPGAGKTLTGLQVVHNADMAAKDWSTVFLSGNGPLLRVLRAALARDYASRQGSTQEKAKRYADALLHSVHSYLEEALKRLEAPSEAVIVFDEAQRAWDQKKMEKMAGRQKRFAGDTADSESASSKGATSEPHQIMSIMDRHAGGAVVIALCGSGQEIHDGEAGVSEWMRARDNAFSHWHIRYSSEALSGSEPPSSSGAFVDEALHLRVPLRAHRASKHAEWVDAVLTGSAEKAAALVSQLDFPIVLTRELDQARSWLEVNTIGTRRSGLVASSGGARLRYYGIEVSADFRKSVDYAKWFTGPRGDINSSFAHEVAATEFECQGLELDRVAVCWCWDLLISAKATLPRILRGMLWQEAKAGRPQEYIINKYRVLMTRAREGMIIWVPKGSTADSSRLASEVDQVASYLESCGIRSI